MTAADPAPRQRPDASSRAAIIGGGPAGLMAAELLGQAGWSVDLYDRMPTVGRKLLMAGRGGLNLTHSESLERFLHRYGPARDRIAPLVAGFGPADLRAWAAGLGQDTFVGSSGRVFPQAFKASPLLRAWLGRLALLGVRIHTRERWLGWTTDRALRFDGPAGLHVAPRPDRLLLALGGASWASLGSDGAWSELLAEEGIQISPFKPANCGFIAPWSDVFRARFAGQPLKNVSLSFAAERVRGEVVISARGLEGGAVYALSAPIRDEILSRGSATVCFDLRPDVDESTLAGRLSRRRRGDSASNWLRRSVSLEPVAANLLRESAGGQLPQDPRGLARLIKAAPIRLTGPDAMDKAISTAGGVAWRDVGADLQLGRLPGVYCAGEMLDWEAPTGGYLLQAVFASGVAAARAMAEPVGAGDILS